MFCTISNQTKQNFNFLAIIELVLSVSIRDTIILEKLLQSTLQMKKNMFIFVTPDLKKKINKIFTIPDNLLEYFGIGAFNDCTKHSFFLLTTCQSSGGHQDIKHGQHLCKSL